MHMEYLVSRGDSLITQESEDVHVWSGYQSWAYKVDISSQVLPHVEAYNIHILKDICSHTWSPIHTVLCHSNYL